MSFIKKYNSVFKLADNLIKLYKIHEKNKKKKKKSEEDKK